MKSLIYIPARVTAERSCGVRLDPMAYSDGVKLQSDPPAGVSSKIRRPGTNDELESPCREAREVVSLFLIRH